jgi:hypothetical protein
VAFLKSIPHFTPGTSASCLKNALRQALNLSHVHKTWRVPMAGTNAAAGALPRRWVLHGGLSPFECLEIKAFANLHGDFKSDAQTMLYWTSSSLRPRLAQVAMPMRCPV